MGTERGLEGGGGAERERERRREGRGKVEQWWQVSFHQPKEKPISPNNLLSAIKARMALLVMKPSAPMEPGVYVYSTAHIAEV